MNDLGKQLMNVLDRAFTPAPPKDRDAETIRCDVDCSTFDRKPIFELDARYDKCYAILCNSGYAAAKAAYLDHQKVQEQMLVDGNFKGDFFTLKDWVEEMAERGQTARREMALLSQQAAAICRPICVTVARHLTEQALEAEAADKAQCARYAIDFTGSPVAVRLRQLATTVMARVANPGAKPKSYAPFLFE
jgi:hypothetical protein